MPQARPNQSKREQKLWNDCEQFEQQIGVIYHTLRRHAKRVGDAIRQVNSLRDEPDVQRVDLAKAIERLEASVDDIHAGRGDLRQVAAIAADAQEKAKRLIGFRAARVRRRGLAAYRDNGRTTDYVPGPQKWDAGGISPVQDDWDEADL